MSAPLTEADARLVIERANMKGGLKRRLLEQWIAGVPGARFSVYALAVRQGRITEPSATESRTV